MEAPGISEVRPRGLRVVARRPGGRRGAGGPPRRALSFRSTRAGPKPPRRALSFRSTRAGPKSPRPALGGARPRRGSAAVRDGSRPGREQTGAGPALVTAQDPGHWPVRRSRPRRLPTGRSPLKGAGGPRAAVSRSGPSPGLSLSSARAVGVASTARLLGPWGRTPAGGGVAGSGRSWRSSTTTSRSNRTRSGRSSSRCRWSRRGS